MAKRGRETDRNTDPEELLSQVAYVLLRDNSTLSGLVRFACWSHWEPRFLQSVEDTERRAFHFCFPNEHQAHGQSQCTLVSQEWTPNSQPWVHTPAQRERRGKEIEKWQQAFVFVSLKCWRYANAHHQFMKPYFCTASTFKEQPGDVHFRVGRNCLFWVIATTIRQDNVGVKENCEQR